MRLGKWFVQPQEGVDPACTQQNQEQAANSIPTKNNHLSFSFSFVVHGESTLCASIDVRQHPVVRRITQRHLAAAQASNAGIHGTFLFNSRRGFHSSIVLYSSPRSLWFGRRFDGHIIQIEHGLDDAQTDGRVEAILSSRVRQSELVESTKRPRTWRRFRGSVRNGGHGRSDRWQRPHAIPVVLCPRLRCRQRHERCGFQSARCF